MSAATPPGINAVRDIPLLAVLFMGLLAVPMLAVWIVSLPFLLVHTLAAIVLSGLTQRDWSALMRSLPPKEPEATS